MGLALQLSAPPPRIIALPPVSWARCQISSIGALAAKADRPIVPGWAAVVHPHLSQLHAHTMLRTAVANNLSGATPSHPLCRKMTLPDAVAYYAILALALAYGNVTVAACMLATFCAAVHLQNPANMPDYVRYWAGRMDAEGNLDRRAHNAGAHEQVSQAQCDRAYQGIISWKKDGRPRPYQSVDDARDNCLVVRGVLAETGVQVETLFDRITSRHPNLKWGKLTVRVKLSAANKASRVAICRQLLESFGDKLHRVVFLDQKTVYMWEEDVYGWFDTSEPNFAEGIKAAFHGGKVIRLKYYGAVHSKLGAFFIRFYTGTTGKANTHDGNNYMVSSRAKQLWRATLCHMHHSKLELCSPLLCLLAGTADALVNPQPQDTPPLPNCLLSIQAVFQLPFSKATVSVVGLCQ